ncbi:hypothetical protein [Streptomyces bobili]
MHHRPQDGQSQPGQFFAKPLPLDVTEPQGAHLLQKHGFRHGAVRRRMPQAGQQCGQGGLEPDSTTRPDRLHTPSGAAGFRPRHTLRHPIPSDGLVTHTTHPLPDDTTDPTTTR